MCVRAAAKIRPGRGQKSSPRPDTNSTRIDNHVRATAPPPSPNASTTLPAAPLRKPPGAQSPTLTLERQNISNAGKRAGITGPHSSLWHHITTALRVLRPSLVFVENVAALRTRGLDVVHTDLATLGYDTSWLCLRASDIGAPHRRDRLFLLYLDTLAQS
ncbi:DNA cytosine methyltransferase [Micromonospora aurantiaca (nom. illeg.)]|uniref:DNA cytosine methyltransferase n=1 Tax=Micromonospora aurantiaca (nom. illeg.) TaxID=47850 RepID=UPI00165745F5|nr:DNA cytosine methyltransferase [Micromonospora aurantiaca]MBC9004611.1 DNA cytosine methyltransferase [Micromonospora aurantiaca]